MKRSSWHRRKSRSSSRSSILFCSHEFFSTEIWSWVRRLLITMYELLTVDGPALEAGSEDDKNSSSVHSPAMGQKYDGLSHCKLALVFAVVMDVLGVTSLLVGVFASLEIQGEDFGDLLVYSGALLVLFSMAGWVLWYSGNIEGLHLQKDMNGRLGSAMDRLARSVSRRMRIPRTHSSPNLCTIERKLWGCKCLFTSNMIQEMNIQSAGLGTEGLGICQMIM
ncbi:hypothetical protein CCH79_00010876 [Gambusia affinis]|uniref:Transmembrane protein 238 n=1 Tax=Gambusia affinis TaxID=33528 RepID=A0A315VLD5_GAMAF|nr:hypothetical protein CCH79_00010876 [Gambusia affinis]